MITQDKATAQHVPVLIVGGGITGLSAALFLQQQSIPFLLVERHRGTSIHPRARSIDIRTMELFRELGLNAALREVGKALAPAWGILRGHNLVQTLLAIEPQRTGRITFPSQLAGLKALAAQSPETGCRCTQDLSEVVLRTAAVERGGDLRFYHELVSFQQDEQTVRVMIRDRQTGIEQILTADYLIAADGANSPLRTTLQATTTGPGSLGDFLNIYFEADLADLVLGREFSQFLLEEPDLTGYLLTINNRDKWTFQLRYYPEKGQQPSDFSNDKLVSILQEVIGLPQLSIRLISVLPWQVTVRIADQLQHGRAFLAGDSAHTMTPYAGKGANSGVQDAHNLAWKLATVLYGKASPALLHTYNTERQPVGAFYAWLSRAMTDGSGLINESQMPKQAATLLGLPDYTYRSSAILKGDGQQEETANALSGQPGTRLPHLWMDETKQHSTLDWVRGQFILVTSGAPSQWQEASELVANELKLPLSVHSFDKGVTRQAWQQLTHTQPGDALLVRPDGFVSLHLTVLEGASFLVNSLRKLLA